MTGEGTAGTAGPAATSTFLVCGLGSRLCALPVASVLETMRPLPLTPFEGAPSVVLGLAVIRGEALPVLDGGLLAGDLPVRARRFVTVRTGRRAAALAVEEVLGLRSIEATSLEALPPLLSRDEGEAVRALCRRDEGLLFVLEGARLVPGELLDRLDAARGGA